jgi:hypothetical protein
MANILSWIRIWVMMILIQIILWVGVGLCGACRSKEAASAALALRCLPNNTTATQQKEKQQMVVSNLFQLKDLALLTVYYIAVCISSSDGDSHNKRVLSILR